MSMLVKENIYSFRTGVNLSVGISNVKKHIAIPAPDDSRTSGFPSTDTIVADMSEGFSAVVDFTMERSGTPDYQYLLTIYEDDDNSVRVFRRHSTNKINVQIEKDGSTTDYDLEWQDEVLPTDTAVSLGMRIKDDVFEIFINGVRIAWISATYAMPTGMTTMYVGKWTGSANDYDGEIQQVRTWESLLTREQMETLTLNAIISPTVVRDPLNRFVTYTGNSNANGVESPSGRTYTNTLKQFGKDIATGVKDYASDDITGDDTSTYGSLWTTASNGFSGIGELCDLLMTANGGQYIATPQGQGGLLLSIVPAQNNMHPKNVTGVGFSVNPRAYSLIKTMDEQAKIGVPERMVIILGHNEAAQNVANTTFENDLDELFNFLQYYYPGVFYHLIGMQNWNASSGVDETDWNDIKIVIDNYERNGVIVTPGDWAIISGDEIHISEAGHVNMAQEIFADT